MFTDAVRPSMCYEGGSPDPADGEEGRVAILIVGLIGIVLVLVFIFANITSIHMQKRVLLTCADRLASVASNQMDGRHFYGDEGGSVNPLVSQESAREAAETALADLGTTTCRVGEWTALDSVAVVGNEAIVTVRAQSTLSLNIPFLGNVVAPELVVSSAARTS